MCLDKERVSVNIFENDNEVRQLYYKIVACLPVQITRQDDKLPHKICTNCNLKVDELYQFWTLTANSQKTLLRWLEEAEQATTITNIKCEFDADLPAKVEPRDNSSDDENNRKEDVFDDEPYRDESDVPEDHEFEPSNLLNVSLQDGDGLDVKPKKSSLTGTKKKSSELSSGLKLIIKRRAESPSPVNEDFDDTGLKTRKLLPCTECDEKFVSTKRLAIHMKVHRFQTQVFTCEVCMEDFSSEIEKKNHFDIHLTPDGLYTCDDEECDYVSKRICHLKQHIKKFHENDQLVYCDQCGKGFSNKDLIMAHKVKIHGVIPYQCDVCQKLFASKSLLFIHKKFHSRADQVPWQCEYCSKVYSCKKSYSRHVKTHMGLSYECELCTNVSARNSILSFTCGFIAMNDHAFVPFAGKDSKETIT